MYVDYIMLIYDMQRTIYDMQRTIHDMQRTIRDNDKHDCKLDLGDGAGGRRRDILLYNTVSCLRAKTMFFDMTAIAMLCHTCHNCGLCGCFCVAIFLNSCN